MDGSISEAEAPREQLSALLALALRLLGLLGVVCCRGGHCRLRLFTDGHGELQLFALTIDLEGQLVAGRLFADVVDKLCAGVDGSAVNLCDDIIFFQSRLGCRTERTAAPVGRP